MDDLVPMALLIMWALASADPSAHHPEAQSMTSATGNGGLAGCRGAWMCRGSWIDATGESECQGGLYCSPDASACRGARVCGGGWVVGVGGARECHGGLYCRPDLVENEGAMAASFSEEDVGAKNASSGPETDWLGLHWEFPCVGSGGSRRRRSCGIVGLRSASADPSAHHTEAQSTTSAIGAGGLAGCRGAWMCRGSWIDATGESECQGGLYCSPDASACRGARVCGGGWVVGVGGARECHGGFYCRSDGAMDEGIEAASSPELMEEGGIDGASSASETDEAAKELRSGRRRRTWFHCMTDHRRRRACPF